MKQKKVKEAQKRWRREWRKQAARSGRAHARAVAKGAGLRPDPFDAYLARRASTGDPSARELLRKRGFDGSYTYRAYLERVLKTATSGEVRSGAAGELARLDGDGPAVPPATWRWTAW